MDKPQSGSCSWYSHWKGLWLKTAYTISMVSYKALMGQIFSIYLVPKIRNVLELVLPVQACILQHIEALNNSIGPQFLKSLKPVSQEPVQVCNVKLSNSQEPEKSFSRACTSNVKLSNSWESHNSFSRACASNVKLSLESHITTSENDQHWTKETKPKLSFCRGLVWPKQRITVLIKNLENHLCRSKLASLWPKVQPHTLFSG